MSGSRIRGTTWNHAVGNQFGTIPCAELFSLVNSSEMVPGTTRNRFRRQWFPGFPPLGGNQDRTHLGIGTGGGVHCDEYPNRGRTSLRRIPRGPELPRADRRSCHRPWTFQQPCCRPKPRGQMWTEMAVEGDTGRETGDRWG